MNTLPIDSNPASYVPTVLALYLSLPETPIRTSASPYSRTTVPVDTGTEMPLRVTKAQPTTSAHTTPMSSIMIERKRIIEIC